MSQICRCTNLGPRQKGHLVPYSFVQATQHRGQDREQLEGLLVQLNLNQIHQGIVVAL